MLEPTEFTQRLFNELVHDPYKQHRRTHAWEKLVVQKDEDFHRKNILKQGRADFTKPLVIDSYTLPIEDIVLVYCYQYMCMHWVSTHFVHWRNADTLTKYLTPINSRIVFVDFGCGPMTAGAASYKALDRSYPELGVSYTYIGIDNAPAMLAKARTFASYPMLFSNRCTFRYVSSWDILIPKINQLNFSHSASTIILNFTYLFASISLDSDELAKIIIELSKICSQHPIFIVQQNPSLLALNEKWNRFKLHMSDTFSSLVETECTIDYQDAITSNVKPPIKLYYEILENRRLP
ncbi:class I SAM-dependent methyltransferase [Anthocerotibacter panamensis]|uniref:hypothetical protein n=1 Tax=Anthocerotibacter panamensis TaxID=2857077 RepID=UPI001C407CC3|nr:hypothetical protein [Anthocerotibacter panamensis]